MPKCLLETRDGAKAFGGHTCINRYRGRADGSKRNKTASEKAIFRKGHHKHGPKSRGPFKRFLLVSAAYLKSLKATSLWIKSEEEGPDHEEHGAESGEPENEGGRGEEGEGRTAARQVHGADPADGGGVRGRALPQVASGAARRAPDSSGQKQRGNERRHGRDDNGAAGGQVRGGGKACNGNGPFSTVYPFFLLKSLTQKITLGRRGKGKKLGRSVQEPPVPPQNAGPHLRGSPTLTHSPGPKHSLGLTRPQPRAPATAPASVKACAPAATPTRRATPHRPRDSQSPLHLPESSVLLKLLLTRSSSPQSPSVREASAARPASPGIGACAQEPYCVTRASPPALPYCLSWGLCVSPNMQR